ncbi:MAG: VanZ family protein [Phycisphaerae bacterium]|nr:VanZ family protein [Phycisphaerae bacterium]
MALLRRHKYILISLALYWPFLFIIAHIPMPNMVQTTGMSDKTMHVLAYGILVFLAWLALNPYQRVNWTKALPWLILAGMVWYCAFDEWLQGKIGRSSDVGDFAADLAGAAGALLILTILDFWPASMVVCGITVFSLTNFSLIASKPNLAWLNMINNFCGYAAFTLIWIQYAYRLRPGCTAASIRWFVRMAVPGLLLLAFVRGYGMGIKNQTLQPLENYAALLSILAAVTVSWIVLRWKPNDLYAPQRADRAGRRSTPSAKN